MINVTQEFVKHLFWYDPLSGILRWRNTRANNTKPWSIAGTSSNSNGYVQVKIGNDVCLAHRLIWIYVYGSLPECEIDHINRVRTDNRLVNLRSVSRSENKQNKSLGRNNTSGIKGVRFCNRHNKWRAQITLNYKLMHLGTFETAEEAIAARMTAQKALHIHQIENERH